MGASHCFHYPARWVAASDDDGTHFARVAKRTSGLDFSPNLLAFLPLADVPHVGSRRSIRSTDASVGHESTLEHATVPVAQPGANAERLLTQKACSHPSYTPKAVITIHP